MSLIINYDILLVVEVFQSWAGPCECIKPMLYRTSLDNEDIKFCCAAADKIGSLKEYKDKLKPVFLFYKKGALKKTIEGVNTPEIQKLLDNI
ncbi:hypothetical protein GUITHDRAFT_150407 [Guillardia theta CCMP2712]|uniref:Thioredoxin domain-containing protein n=1 Tax=Guillardia theta (strain CCMP2712) TaxID=905079 RepID=L1JZ91_GUITC|nr:hypothetical protein GUITHDRAFT_150407 [Guillardia theta CCMP2712]EKX53418.1 hypothetical protein GUITHDRAFT_150407 [Guillardia theta CCMP2712]|eukprot:XP_005840398.1 hypothetical protein GUITHDRAFT_150407 [Guillardia theta CCMP2712]